MPAERADAPGVPTLVAVAHPRSDHEAERAILGGILLDNAAVATVAAALAPADMHHPAHAAALEAVFALAKAGAGVDVVTLGAELHRRRRLAGVGGHAFLAALTDAAVTNAWLTDHCRIVAEHAAARRVSAAAEEVAAWSANPALEARELVARATARFAKACAGRDGRAVVSLDDAVAEAFARIEAALAAGARTTGLDTGYAQLDQLLGGLRGGQLVIVAARPAVGKTAWVLDVARRVGARGHRVLFLSLEMPRAELADRLLAGQASVDGTRIRDAQLEAGDLDKLTAAAAALHGLPLDIDDRGNMTLLDVCARARQWKLERDVRLVVLDYLQLVKAGPDAPDSRERQIGEISEGLKALAKELDVPVVAVAQLNRKPEDRPNKRPQLGDLRDSGSLEQDADVVLFLYRDEVYNKKSPDRGVAEVICAKQRNGPTDTVRLRFVREQSRFEDLPEEDAPPPQRALPLDDPRAGYTRDPEPEELDRDHAF